jgi:hypothetical protein
VDHTRHRNHAAPSIRQRRPFFCLKHPAPHLIPSPHAAIPRVRDRARPRRDAHPGIPRAQPRRARGQALRVRWINVAGAAEAVRAAQGGLEGEPVRAQVRGEAARAPDEAPAEL